MVVSIVSLYSNFAQENHPFGYGTSVSLDHNRNACGGVADSLLFILSEPEFPIEVRDPFWRAW